MGFPNHLQILQWTNRVVGVHLIMELSGFQSEVFLGILAQGISQRIGTELTLSVAIHTTGYSVQIVSQLFLIFLKYFWCHVG